MMSKLSLLFSNAQKEFEVENYKKCRRLCNEILDFKKDYIPCILLACKCCVELKHWERCLEYLEKIENIPISHNEMVVLKLYATCYEHLNDKEKLIIVREKQLNIATSKENDSKKILFLIKLIELHDNEVILLKYYQSLSTIFHQYDNKNNIFDELDVQIPTSLSLRYHILYLSQKINNYPSHVDDYVQFFDELYNHLNSIYSIPLQHLESFILNYYSCYILSNIDINCIYSVSLQIQRICWLNNIQYYENKGEKMLDKYILQCFLISTSMNCFLLFEVTDSKFLNQQYEENLKYINMIVNLSKRNLIEAKSNIYLWRIFNAKSYNCLIKDSISEAIHYNQLAFQYLNKCKPNFNLKSQRKTLKDIVFTKHCCIYIYLLKCILMNLIDSSSSIYNEYQRNQIYINCYQFGKSYHDILLEFFNKLTIDIELLDCFMVKSYNFFGFKFESKVKVNSKQDDNINNNNNNNNGNSVEDLLTIFLNIEKEIIEGKKLLKTYETKQFILYEKYNILNKALLYFQSAYTKSYKLKNKPNIYNAYLNLILNYIANIHLLLYKQNKNKHELYESMKYLKLFKKKDNIYYLYNYNLTLMYLGKLENNIKKQKIAFDGFAEILKLNNTYHLAYKQMGLYYLGLF